MKRLSLAFLTGALALSFGFPAEGAITLTQVGTWHKAVLEGAGNVTMISATGAGGATYVNGLGGVVQDNKFITVGAVPLASLQVLGGPEDANPDGTSDATILGFALEGFVQSIDANNKATVQFTAGAYGVVTPPSFFTGDPDTWGFVDGVGAFIQPQSWGVLKGQEPIDQGDPLARYISAFPWEVQVVSGVVGNHQTLGGILLAKQLDDGSPLITVDNPVIPPPYDQLPMEEGVAVVFDSTIETIQIPVAGGNYTIVAADVATMNTMFLGLFSTAGLTPSNAFGWATGFGAGPVTNYNATGNPLLGDFPTSLDTTVEAPCVEMVPEPASVVVWGLIGLAGVLLFRRRK